MTEQKQNTETDEISYEPPLLVVYGDATDLTLTGKTGNAEGSSNNGSKRSASAV